MTLFRVAVPSRPGVAQGPAASACAGGITNATMAAPSKRTRIPPRWPRRAISLVQTDGQTETVAQVSPHPDPPPRGGRVEGHPYRCAPGLASEPGRPLARRAHRHPGLLLRVSLPTAVSAPGAAHLCRPPARVLDGDHGRRDRVCARLHRSDLGPAGRSLRPHAH